MPSFLSIVILLYIMIEEHWTWSLLFADWNRITCAYIVYKAMLILLFVLCQSLQRSQFFTRSFLGHHLRRKATREIKPRAHCWEASFLMPKLAWKVPLKGYNLSSLSSRRSMPLLVSSDGCRFESVAWSEPDQSSDKVLLVSPDFERTLWVR